MQALVYNVTPVRWSLCKAAGFFSKQAYFSSFSPLKLRDCPIPELPGPGWVRLKTILGGICGTDLALVTQRLHPATILQNYATFPAILGHENVAIVDEVGSEVSEWKPGRRVCVEPAPGCHAHHNNELCPHCLAGRTSLCENAGGAGLPPRTLLGLNTITGGSWGQYFLAHHTQLHAVPDSVPDDTAVLVDSIASAAHAVLRRPPEPGENVLVSGSGIIALGVVAAIRALGLDNPVTSLVRHGFQADLARSLGATQVECFPRRAGSVDRYDTLARLTNGKRLAARFGNQDLLGGFDLTFECTGSGAGLSDAVKWTRSRGTVVAVGTSGITLLHTTAIWFNELQIVGANGRQIESCQGRDLHTYDLVFRWIEEGRLDLSALPVQRYRLADYRTAFKHLFRRGRHPVVKAAFEH
ncbi:MAG: alcohol dehydrogenase catalytic domain-containing protein [Planctomycetota bacterium]